MKQRIAVTGGSGQLGRAVVDDLLAHGYDPFIVDRASDPAARCRTAVADLTDYGEVVDVLAGQGHEVVARADGASALAHLDGPSFDLALVDLSMPGLSGWDVAKGLRAAQPQVPIALVTGWGDQIDFEEARARGIDYLMAKPFNVDDMNRLVGSVLARAPSADR